MDESVPDAGAAMDGEAVDRDVSVLAALAVGRRSPDTLAADRWPALVALADRHRMGPMLEWSLRQARFALPSRSAAAVLTRSALRSARRYSVQEIAHHEISALLTRAAIPAIWLKGAALARTLYPDPTLRPMSDLDVLVSPEQCVAAVDLLCHAGYRLAALDQFGGSNVIQEPAAKSNHHYELIGGPADAVAVEVHFRLLAQNDELLPLESQALFWEHTEQALFDDGVAFTMLTCEANLLYLAAHAILQHGESETLLHYLDVHLLISKYAPDWRVLVDRAVELDWSGAVERALCKAARYFGTPVPEEVFRELIRGRTARERASTVLHSSGAGLRWERARGTLGGMSWGGRVRYVWGSLLPSAKYMRRKYDVREQRPLWRLYLHRWRDQAGDVLWALRKRKAGGSAGASPSMKALDSTSVIERLLSEKTPVSFRAGGQSMRPVIGDGDSVRVTPWQAGRIPRGSIVLYRRGAQLVLHRAVDISDEIVTVADAAVEGEARVPRDDVIGVAEHVRHGERIRRLDTRRARWFGLMWYRLRPARRVWSRIRNVNRKVRKEREAGR